MALGAPRTPKKAPNQRWDAPPRHESVSHDSFRLDLNDNNHNNLDLDHLDQQQSRRQLEPNPNFANNVLVLLLQWSDHADRKLPDAYEYQVQWNLRVAEYFRLNSYDKYNVWYDVIPWQITDNTEAHYSFGKSGRTTDLQAAFYPLLDALDAQGTDWSVYDSNGDGVLDNLMILHSGYAAELGQTDCNNNRGPTERIWRYVV